MKKILEGKNGPVINRGADVLCNPRFTYNSSGPPHPWIPSHRLNLKLQEFELLWSTEKNSFISGPVQFQPFFLRVNCTTKYQWL